MYQCDIRVLSSKKLSHSFHPVKGEEGIWICEGISKNNLKKVILKMIDDAQLGDEDITITISPIK